MFREGMEGNGNERRNVLPIERVRRIDSRHIEFYWGREPVSGKRKNMVFHVYRDGTELELYERKDDDEWDVGTVHETAKRRTTVTLAREIGERNA